MATPFVKFPGGAGDYVWTEDTNQCDADTAHCVQGVGVWSDAGGTTGFTTSAVLTPVFGTSHGQCEKTAPSVNAEAWHGGGAWPVSPSTEYVMSEWVAATATPRQVRMLVQWRDGGGGVISTDYKTLFDAPINTWVNLENVETSPANAASLSFGFRFTQTGGGNLPTAELYYFDATCLRLGSDGTFLPSLDIQGTRFVSEVSNPSPAGEAYTKGQDQRLGASYTGDVSQWAIHDGVDADAPIVAQMLALDALRALPL